LLNVLLIDENPVEYRLINQMLKDCHKGPYVIRHADTYEKAITIRKTQKTDIILVDSKLLEAGAPGAGAAALVSISTETKSPEVLTSININVDYLVPHSIRPGDLNCPDPRGACAPHEERVNRPDERVDAVGGFALDRAPYFLGSAQWWRATKARLASR